MSNDIQLSRPATATPWGKCDTRVQAMLPEVAALEIRRRAAASGVSESEWLRTQLLTVVYGKDMVRASLIQQFESMVGTDSVTQLGAVA